MFIPTPHDVVCMSDDLFHCVCRTCPEECVADTVAGRARFFEEHADHEVVTVPLPPRDEPSEPAGRIVELRASN
jgi:hypothetical protein